MSPDHAEQAVQQERRVKPFELFFDLVFVFGLTQVTSLMSSDPTWGGIGRGLLVLAALWWAWVGYVWLATTVDLEEGATRGAMIGVMAAMFVASLAVPGAFGKDAMLFGVAYGIVRVLHLVLYVVAARGDPALLKSIMGLVPGTFTGPGLIVAGAVVGGDLQVALFAAGLLVDYAGPLIFDSDGWHVSAEHFHERHGLIVIVALGESLVATGIGVGDDLGPATVAGAVLAVVATTAIWWTYFDVTSLYAFRVLEAAEPKVRNAMARDSFSYLHLPMVAGIVLFALGSKKTLGHESEHLSTEVGYALSGGVALYLLAIVLFRLRNVRTVSRPRSVGAVALLVVAAFTPRLNALDELLLVAVVAWSVVAWEAIRYREARAKVRSGEHWA